MLYSDTAGRLQLARERAAELTRDYKRAKSPSLAPGDAAPARRVTLAALLRRDRAGQESASRA